MEKQKRIVTKIGNIFSVRLDDECKRYFQYIANDLTQLNSSVIRVFETRYPLDANPKLTDVVNDRVDFYAHTILSLGIRLGYWEKVGKVPYEETYFDVLFVTWCDDVMVTLKYCSPLRRWRTWHINDPDFTYVDTEAFTLSDTDLTVNYPEFKNEKYIMEGPVIPPNEIYHRIKTGRYTYKGSWPRWPDDEQ